MQDIIDTSDSLRVEQEIYDVLHKDHTQLRSLLTDLVNLSSDEESRHSALIKAIELELIPHARAEEAVFYNCLRTIDSTKETVMHGFKEHLGAEGLLRTLQAKDKIDADWHRTAMKLKDAIEHHIADEELTIFDAARRALSKEEACQLAHAFLQVKEKVRNDSWAKNTWDLIVNLLPPRFANSVRKISA